MMDRNITNWSSPAFPLRQKYYNLFQLWIGLMLFLAAFGTVLNFLLFSAIVSSRKLSSGCGTLIAHSIFLETALCAFVVPFRVALHWSSVYYSPTKTICRAIWGVFYIVVWGFNWSTVFVTANRFVALWLPQKYAACVTKRSLSFAIISSWTIVLCSATGILLDTVATANVDKMWGGCLVSVTRLEVYGALTAVGTSVPAVLEGVMYGLLFAFPCFQRIFQSHWKTVDANPSPESMANDQRLMAIRARRLRMTQTVFGAFVWTKLCFMFGPICKSAFSSNARIMELVPLLAPAIILLGYSTSPVSSLGENTTPSAAEEDPLSGFKRICSQSAILAENMKMLFPTF